MQIKQIVSPMFSTNCYIVSNDNETVLIDCGESAEIVLQEIEKCSPLTKIIFTHGHFDHIMSANEIKAKTGAKVYVSEEDKDCLSSTEKSLAKRFGITHDEIVYDAILQDTITICGNEFSVIKTPGHSKGSVCLLFEDILFSGDTLFYQSIGRYEEEDHEIIKNSLKLLMTLPDNTKVYPGHGNATTIGFERIYNPFLNFETNWG